MNVIEDAWNAAELPSPVVATIGNFDGLHRGQRAIIGTLVERSRALGLPAALVTFEPHPLTVLRPEAAPQLLLTGLQKRRLLAETGLDHALVIHFDASFARVRAADFVRDFLARRLRAAEIYVGSRFVFGYRREGDLRLLRELGRELGFSATGVEEVLEDGEPISSTRIRRAVSEGRVGEAMKLLGRPYALCGRVARGLRRGHELGWPTINLETANALLPADGVYATEVAFTDGRPWASVTNVGRRPTFGEGGGRMVESHLLGFDREAYGEDMEVRFHRRLRGERAFPGVEALREQIAEDVRRAREYLASGTR